MRIEYELDGKVAHIYPDEGLYITQAGDVPIESRQVCPSIGVKAAWKDRWRECTREEVKAWEVELRQYWFDNGITFDDDYLFFPIVC